MTEMGQTFSLSHSYPNLKTPSPLFRTRDIKAFFVCLNGHLVVAHVFVMPVTLQPVLGGVLLHKVVDSVPEVVRLQQKQLDYEVANLSLIPLVASHRLKEENGKEH